MPRHLGLGRHELMHRLIPGSVLTVIPGAGWLPTLEQPAQTTAALCRWLADPATGAGARAP